MFLIERYLRHFKKYVRNKARLECSIAEGYIVQEALTFSSQYLRMVESKFSIRKQDDDLLKHKTNYSLEVFRLVCRTIGKNEYYYLSRYLLDKTK